MMTWFADNGGTIAITLLLIGIVAAVIHSMRRDRKRGKSPCGGQCGCCPMSGACHKK